MLCMNKPVDVSSTGIDVDDCCSVGNSDGDLDGDLDGYDEGMGVD